MCEIALTLTVIPILLIPIFSFVQPSEFVFQSSEM